MEEFHIIINVFVAMTLGPKSNVPLIKTNKQTDNYTMCRVMLDVDSEKNGKFPSD